MKATPSNIVRVQDFITKSEAKFFIDYCDSIFPEKEGARAILQVHKDHSIKKQVSEYTSKVQQEVEHECGFHLSDLTGTSMRKWYSGEKQDPHADCEAVFYRDHEGLQMKPINNPSSLFIEYAALTYLNDDFEGGEIYFPEYDIEIKPKTGQLVFFPGSSFYTHGVRPITSGTRYAIMTFFTTPKLMYLWRNFVLDDYPLMFTDRTQNDEDIAPIEFTRSNVPRSLQKIGDAPLENRPKTPEEIAQMNKENANKSSQKEQAHPTPPPTKKKPKKPVAQVFGKESSMIKVVDDFVPQGDIDKIMKMASRVTDWNHAPPGDEWHARLAGIDKLRALDEDVSDLFEMHAKSVKHLAEELFDCKLMYRDPALVRYRAGMHTPEAHADKQHLDGSFKEGMEDWDLSAVLYLNDDFEGGDLVFPQHDTRVAPTAGRVVIYPGDDAYLHYVDHVTAGVRWACPIFFTVISKNA